MKDEYLQQLLGRCNIERRNTFFVLTDNIPLHLKVNNFRSLIIKLGIHDDDVLWWVQMTLKTKL